MLSKKWAIVFLLGTFSTSSNADECLSYWYLSIPQFKDPSLKSCGGIQSICHAFIDVLGEDLLSSDDAFVIQTVEKTDPMVFGNSCLFEMRTQAIKNVSGDYAPQLASEKVATEVRSNMVLHMKSNSGFAACCKKENKKYWGQSGGLEAYQKLKGQAPLGPDQIRKHETHKTDLRGKIAPESVQVDVETVVTVPETGAAR